jgi:adenosylcobinamide-GDP ribazoletransferase
MRSLHAEFRYFLAAVQVLTRLPVPYLRDFTADWLERGVKFFPLAGALVGGMCGVVLLAASALWSGMLPALLAVAAGIALTGAFHEDGLADFFDALGGSTRASRLAIMKDSRHGTYGVLALGIAVAIKVLALAALPATAGLAALIAAHAGGRLAAVAVIRALPYTGDLPAAKVKPLGGAITRSDLAIAAAFGLLPILLLPHAAGLWGCLAGLAAASLTAWGAHRLLGGYTGDVLGAVEQSYEIAFFLGAAACA